MISRERFDVNHLSYSVSRSKREILWAIRSVLRSREKPLKLSCTNLRWFCFEHARLRHLPESSKIPRQLEELNTEALILEQRAALLTAVCNGVEQFPAAANELGNHEEAGPIDARLAQWMRHSPQAA